MYKLYYKRIHLCRQQIKHNYFIVDIELPTNHVLLNHLFSSREVTEYDCCFYKYTTFEIKDSIIRNFNAVKTVDYDHLLKIYNIVKSLKVPYHRINEVVSDLDSILINWSLS